MLRRVLIGALLASVAAVFTGEARAAAQVLMPNVSYQRTVQFTAHGPVALNVIVGPRPGGLYQLKPLLSNNAILGTERVTSMQKDVSSQATVAGVNGDLFNFNDGHPSGMLMQDKVLESPPYRARSSVGITADGKLQVARVSFFGYWQGLGQRRPLTGVNQPPRADGTSLFTPAYGATTPRIPGVWEVVLQPFPPAVPGTDLTGVVTATHSGGGQPIPKGGAVLLARGSQVAKLQAEATIGTSIVSRLVLSPDWLAAGVTDALGGGPLIVRNGKAVWTAGEDFLPTQLGPRNPRTAVGQRRDGKIVLLAVDGRRRGSSVGMTNWELAQAMVRLGCVTASALDAGGATAFTETISRQPGVYAYTWPATTKTKKRHGLRRLKGHWFRTLDSNPLGRWRWVISATDDQGQASSVERSFWLNDTLGFMKVAPRSVRVTKKTRTAVVARFKLAFPARVTPSIWTPGGVLIRRLPGRNLGAGMRAIAWNGRFQNGRLVYRGRYVFKVFAKNAYGPVDLDQAFVVRR